MTTDTQIRKHFRRVRMTIFIMLGAFMVLTLFSIPANGLKVVAGMWVPLLAFGYFAHHLINETLLWCTADPDNVRPPSLEAIGGIKRLVLVGFIVFMLTVSSSVVVAVI